MPPNDCPKPTLYGISNSNRKPSAFWGKNQFNSAFPAALACWMRDQDINPVYVHTCDGVIFASDEKISFDDVFNSTAPNEKLRFDFEVKFPGFHGYSFDSLEAIDLVVSEDEVVGRALEVKLTVLPDQTTFAKSEDQWGCELVVRPVSVIYAALTIYHLSWPRKSDHLVAKLSYGGGVRRIDGRSWFLSQGYSSYREKGGGCGQADISLPGFGAGSPKSCPSSMDALFHAAFGVAGFAP